MFEKRVEWEGDGGVRKGGHRGRRGHRSEYGTRSSRCSRKAYKAAYIWELLPWTSLTLSRTQRFHLRWFYIRKQCFPPARPVTSAFNRLFKETKFIILKTEPHVRVVSTVTVTSVQTYLKVFLNACTLKSRCKYTIKEYKSPEKMALFPIRILLSFPRGVESEPAAEAARWNK